MSEENQNHLAFELVSASGSAPSRTGVLLHGILGLKKNLLGIAQKMANAFHGWQWVVVDLRNHGDSRGFVGPHTLEACAGDILDLMNYLNLKPEAIVGHSFGGKVALAYSEISEVSQVWVWDSAPGEEVLYSANERTDSVGRVIEVLKSLPMPIISRAQLVQDLLAGGLSKDVALWMTTNLKTRSEGLVFKFDLGCVEEMLDSYFGTSFWPLLRLGKSGTDYHFICAQKGNRFSEGDLKELEALTQSHVYLHRLENAGHWLHIDNPEGVVQQMKPYFI